MYEHEISIRVRYGETDQMGVVYHGNYPQYLELGRVEWLRNLGFSYRDMEIKGCLLMVVSLSLNYKKPAVYDELIFVKTRLKNIPTVRITFDYEIRSASGQLLATAETVLAFTDAKTYKPMRCPNYLLEKLS
ncbi:acyl-CoA thioesterase [Robiginitalea sp.]|nr:acyl-CoA thioesterase [Robiginitalea sp.]